MEPETSHSQPTGEHNATSIILARLEAMSRDMARMTAGIEKLDSDVVSMKGEVSIMGGRLERVESQRSRPSTPRHISPTSTPEAMHQMLYLRQIKPTLTPKSEIMIDQATLHFTKSNKKDLEPKYHHQTQALPSKIHLTKDLTIQIQSHRYKLHLTQIDLSMLRSMVEEKNMLVMDLMMMFT